METVITSYCKIVPNKISVGGKLFFEEASEKELPEFLSASYKHTELNYPKFHKMDKLCKLGMLAAELAIRNCPDWESQDKSRTALVFSNHSSSLDSDRNHAHAISDKQNYFPSPSVFVYTLPNIIMGEIAIKHKISGENAFFISDQFDPELLFSYSDILLHTSNTEFVVCGWVNLDRQHNEAFVYCIKKSNFREQNVGHLLKHTVENIRQLYNT